MFVEERNGDIGIADAGLERHAEDALRSCTRKGELDYALEVKSTGRRRRQSETGRHIYPFPPAAWEHFRA